MKLWIYGDSNSLDYNLPSNAQSWPEIVAQKLGLELINRARPAVDNFFIYQSWKQDLVSMSNHDRVVVGWSHFSRKVFVHDKSKADQNKVIAQSLTYNDHGRMFMRSRGSDTDAIDKFQHLAPKDSDITYYDTWFNNYYNEYESKTNLQSYIDSVYLRQPNAIQFYFSKVGTLGLDISDSSPLYILDFLLDNNLFISYDDCHANVQGHLQWADLILEKFNAI